MDSIVSYQSDNEHDSDSEHKSRESNSAQSHTSHNSGSYNRAIMKPENHEIDKCSPDRRRKSSKLDSHAPDRATSQRTKSDKSDGQRSRGDNERSRNDDRSRNELDRSRIDNDRSRNDRDKCRDKDHERRHENRTRIDKRRQSDRQYSTREHRTGRSNREQRSWRNKSSSRERHVNPESPGSDKREKERKRSHATSTQDKNLYSNKNLSSSHQDSNHNQNRSSRGHDRLSDGKDQLYSTSSTRSTYQSLSASTVASESDQQKPPEQTTSLPSYYNPSVINPNKYAEQVQKRKLLWGNKKSEGTASKWGNAKFAQDTDGKVASKFMRLMGIKDQPKPGDEEATTSTSTAIGGESIIKKQEEMFSSMEQQYEVARQVTHTMRGVGLGFSSQSRPF